MTGFDETWARTTIAALGAAGVEIAPGLGPDEIAAIGEAFGVDVPEELALLLTAGVPASERWTVWSDPHAEAADARAWIDRAFAFDIEHDDYWHPLLGTRPDDVGEAIDQAQAVLATAPPLIPIYGHRFLSTGVAPRPVLSVWQAGDTIVYGADLADYFARDHGIPGPPWAPARRPDVPIWADLFDL